MMHHEYSCCIMHTHEGALDQLYYYCARTAAQGYENQGQFSSSPQGMKTGYDNFCGTKTCYRAFRRQMKRHTAFFWWRPSRPRQFSNYNPCHRRRRF